MTEPAENDRWPDIPYPAWRDTQETLHLWTQIVGKVRLAQTPWVNHGWHATLYVSARGLTTSLVSTPSGGFEIEFDFVDHRLRLHTSAGGVAEKPLHAQSVSAFHCDVREMLASLELDPRFNGRPNEIVNPQPFGVDDRARSYDADAAQRFWRALVECDRVFKLFRTRYVGKCSPVHFFWGSFDLAVTRFSGRVAPPHPGGVPHLPDPITREAYSHEVSSAGFWPGGGAVDYPAFYSYAYPEPSGFRTTPVRPDAAKFLEAAGEYILAYDAVRAASSPDDVLLDFLQSTYDAAADRARWDRERLELPPGRIGHPPLIV